MFEFKKVCMAIEEVKKEENWDDFDLQIASLSQESHKSYEERKEPIVNNRFRSSSLKNVQMDQLGRATLPMVSTWNPFKRDPNFLKLFIRAHMDACKAKILTRREQHT